MIKIDTENYDEEYIQLVKDYKEVFSGDTGKKVLEDLFMQENALHQELLNTSFLTFTGRTQGVIAREKRDIARDIRVEESKCRDNGEDIRENGGRRI
jgi:hypothetical protein